MSEQSSQDAAIESTHKPYVSDSQTMPEFTASAVTVGALLGILFGASSLYLVMKVGMTVSASIPVAVLAITLFRVFSKAFGFRRATILENNIVQTTGSAGESIAFGVGVTMPAVMILGFEMEISRVMVVSVLGGLLGVLMMVPLRRAFCVKQHDTLKFPEGTACADVLVIGETGGATAKTVFAGFGIAFLFQFLNSGMKLWKETVARPLTWLKGATPAMDVSPALLGVGYIIGPRVASIMVAGGVLAWLVLCPTLMYFGEGLNSPLSPATSSDPLIRDMSSGQLREFYVLYIGAGAVAAGGIISMCRTLPLIISSIYSGLRDMRSAGTSNSGPVRRTDDDFSVKSVLLGCLALIAGIWAFLLFDPQAGGGFTLGSLGVSFIAALLIVLFGFLFVVVSARLTGEIGSSSNPISGMTVATLLLTCLIFLLAGLTSHKDQLLALSVAAVVCIACSNGGTNAQALKTGYLVGATPKWQQWAMLTGSLTSALVIGTTLLALNYGSTVYSSLNKNLPKTGPAETTMAALKATDKRERAPGDDAQYLVWRPVQGNPEHVKPGKYLVDDQGHVRWLVDPGINGSLKVRDDGTEVKKFDPPQAQLFALITQGILNQRLPWILVVLGVLIAVVMELCGIRSLPFAVGVYLPLSSTTPIFAGGLVRGFVEWLSRRKGEKALSDLESEMSPGSLFSTGYIAGGTIGAVLINFLIFAPPSILAGLAVWQYRTEPAPAAATFDDQTMNLAKAELGTKASAAETKLLADGIRELNESRLPEFIAITKGTTLKLPENKHFTATADTTLANAAESQLGSKDKVRLLFDINEDQLKLPAALPAGTAMKLPQGNAPALILFGAMAVLLVLVGRGWLLKTKTE